MEDLEDINIENLEDLDIIGELNIVVRDSSSSFSKELEDLIEKARTRQKRVEYYSDNVIIYSYKKELNLGQTILIFETIYRNTNENNVEFSYIANKSMYGSHLIYLINRAELRSK
ncbi:MAG: hypothetical protein ACFFBH_09500 [Promethearchaeota archaeon]